MACGTIYYTREPHPRLIFLLGGPAGSATEEDESEVIDEEEENAGDGDIDDDDDDDDGQEEAGRRFDKDVESAEDAASLAFLAGPSFEARSVWGASVGVLDRASG